MKKHFFTLAAFLFLLFPLIIFSSGAEVSRHNYSLTFLWIAVILLAAKTSSLIEKFGQPAVLGELIIGIVIGNLGLVGINIFENLSTDIFIPFLAELGVVILLFQVGLESNIQQMKKVGVRALLVACVGVVAPFILGTFIVGPFFLKGLPFNSYLFLGTALVATSVGITARVFKDLNKTQLKESQIILGAAVIDDVLGLIILAIVSAIVVSGTVNLLGIGVITIKAFVFLVGAIFLGQIFAPKIGQLFSKIHTGIGMKFTLAVSFGLVLAFVAKELGLAPIVGAFAAGLVLDPVHFKFFKKPKVVYDLQDVSETVNHNVKKIIEKKIHEYSERHIEDLIEPIAHFLVPIFFVMTGFTVNLQEFFKPPIILTAIIITLVAILGKVVSGLVAGRVNKLIVGVGMVPRGEVGLIFAMTGKSLGVVSDSIYSIIIIVVILSTLLTPPVLTYLIKKSKV